MAYNLVAYPSLRPQLILDQFATVRATKQTHRGSSVRFSFVDDLAEATTPLLENIDVDSAAMEAKGLVVPMQEYGNAVTTTALLRGTSMIPIDPLVAERVGYNAGASIDTLAGTALQAGSVTYDDGTTGTVETVDDPDGLSRLVCVRQSSSCRRRTLVPARLLLDADRFRTGHGPAWRGNHFRQPGDGQSSMREEGMAGNNIFYGQVGTYEGVNILHCQPPPRSQQGDLAGCGVVREGVQQRCRIRGHPEHGRVAGCGQVASFRKHRLASLGRLQHFPYRLAGVHRHHDNPVVSESPPCPYEVAGRGLPHLGTHGFKRTKKQRLNDNKGVRDGTIRKGKAGKGLRRWNKSTGRWEKVAVKNAAKTYRSISSRGKTEDAKKRESKRAKNPNLGLGGKNKNTFSLVQKNQRVVLAKAVVALLVPVRATRALTRILVWGIGTLRLVLV